MDELHQGLQILRSRGTYQSMNIVANVKLCAALLAGERLLQVGGQEVTQSTLRENRVAHRYFA